MYRICTLLALAAISCSADPVTNAAPSDPIVTPGEIEAGSKASTEINPRLLRRFKPLQPVVVTNRELVDVGRMLFFDKRLSRDLDLSCNSCHQLHQFGVDNEPTSIGAMGKRGRRNSPSVYHASGHIRSFWDGRAPNVEEQAKGPIINSAEMAMLDGDAVVKRLNAIPGYVAAFTRAFPDGKGDAITYDRVGTAIGAFERGLMTPARWDRYLTGEVTALTPAEVSGFKTFASVGCVSCHTGEFIGGSSFQKVGVASDWPNQTDRGRFEITKVDSDHMIFKVPSLRNVVMTAPYFHDGSAPTLAVAVKMMATHQLAEPLTAEEVAGIVAWFGSLTGELPTNYIKEPALPPDA